jgi:hypothetical protein
MPRALTSDEFKKVTSKAKVEGSRPFVYESSTGEYNQISKDFEAFLILTPAGIKAKAAQFISTIIRSEINNSVIRTNLLRRWAQDEMADIAKEIEGYKDILDIYDSIIPTLGQAKGGFEDVTEVNVLFSGFNLLMGEFAETRDSLKFDRAASSVLNNRSGGNLPSDIKKELESYARALLSYD